MIVNAFFFFNIFSTLNLLHFLPFFAVFCRYLLKITCKILATDTTTFMITTKFYLDTRATKNFPEKSAPIKLVISKRGTTALLSTGIKVTSEQWDKKKLVVIKRENEKKLNFFLSKFRLRIENIILDAQTQGDLAGMNASQIKEYVSKQLTPEEEIIEAPKDLFSIYYIRYSNTKSGRTREIYETTLKRIKEFCPNVEELTFADIDKNWLQSFDAHLAKTSPSRNARNIHLRNIRAVFNHAIEEEVTSSYPFRKYKLKNEPTMKRSLSIGQLRDFFFCEPWGIYKEYQDIFKLIFYLCGINLIDLFNLTKENIINGRIEYRRAKTGKLYSILITPEAQEIINKYQGEKYLLNIHDRYKNHKDYMQHINRGLSMIGHIVSKNKNGVPIMKPICSSLSTYWARHTWATIAAELDIPKETIAAGLGHNIGSPITSIYIDFNLKKVDDANRKIIDYVCIESKKELPLLP